MTSLSSYSFDELMVIEDNSSDDYAERLLCHQWLVWEKLFAGHKFDSKYDLYDYMENACKVTGAFTRTECITKMDEMIRDKVKHKLDLRMKTTYNV